MENLDASRLEPEVLQELRDIFGAHNVSIRDTDRAAYARDLWPKTHLWMKEGEIPYPPDVVVWAENEAQIVALMTLANRRVFPVIPYGAGSGVCGGTLPIRRGVVLDVKKMNSIIEINDTALSVTAEPGVIGQHLEQELNRKGYTMGHFPSSIYCSSLGGYLAARSAGQLSARYGKIEDMALSIRVVLPNGDIVETVRSPRSAAGPDWKQVFIGSEGTFGVITRATMRIWPYPESRLFRAFTFKGVGPALDSIRQIMRAGVLPACVRLYDELDTILIGGKKEDSVEAPIDHHPQPENPVKHAMHSMSSGLQDMLLGIPKTAGRAAEYIKGQCLLVLTFEGTLTMTSAELETSVLICKKNKGRDQGENPAKRWWENRYNVSYNQSRVFYQGSFVDTIEVATTWDKVEKLYYAMRRAVSPHAFIMAHFSHAYVHGCSIYFSIVSRGSDKEQAVQTYETLWDAAMNTAFKYGATVTHHHGVGLLKAEGLKRELGDLMEVFQDFKRAVDPNNIMNPGKLGLPDWGE